MHKPAGPMGSSNHALTRKEFNTFYTIAGGLLQIETSDDWLLGWVTGFLDGFHLIKLGGPSEREAAVTLSVRRNESFSIPAGLQSFAIDRGFCHTDGRTFFLDVDQSLVVIDEPQTRRVEVLFGSTAHARHPVAMVNAFAYGLQAALRRAGVFDVHAAGVVEPATGAGALFIGSSGSGKTTLTINLTAHGWQYLTDDMIVLRETVAGLTAEGLRRLFAVTELSLAGPTLQPLKNALGDTVASDRTKRKLWPETVFPERRATSCHPRVLFFPRVTGETQTTIAKMSSRAAMERLVRFCPWASYDTVAAPEYLRVLARLANQCQSYDLHAGCDLLGEPARVANLLAPYLEQRETFRGDIRKAS